MREKNKNMNNYNALINNLEELNLKKTQETINSYLDEIYNHFLIAIENKVKNKNKVDVEV